MFKTMSLILISLFIIAACAPSGSAPSSGASSANAPTSAAPAPTTAPAGNAAAAKMIEKYLQAKITGDEQTIRSLLCSAMEKDLQQEATTFLGTSGVKFDGMSCAADGADKVTCQGKIVADYGQEKNEFPLGTYSVVQEDGEWKYCGETQ
jgi:hypothetical protein